MEFERPPVIDETQRALYESIVAGEHGSGEKGVIAFAVSTDRLDDGRGDLFVALGLGKYLARLGWGVRLWPMGRWGEELPEDTDVLVSMLESFVPGLMPDRTARIAWVRNWTDTWTTLPFLGEFDAVWASSPDAAAALAAAGAPDTAVVPIAADAELFQPGEESVTRTVVSTANNWGTPRQIHSVIADVAAQVDVTVFGEGAPLPHVAHGGRVSYFALPAVYRTSLVVIDDLIDQARAYGTQNSRLFESIAAGALPVTNVRTGLDALGLEAVPDYRGADDLLDTVQRLDADPAAAARLREELAAVVRDRHTFEVRARETEPLIVAAVARAAERVRPALFRALAHERASQIFTSTISDHRLAETRRLDERIAELERVLEARDDRIDVLDAALFDASALLAAYRSRRIIRLETSLRRALTTGRR